MGACSTYENNTIQHSSIALYHEYDGNARKSGWAHTCLSNAFSSPPLNGHLASSPAKIASLSYSLVAAFNLKPDEWDMSQYTAMGCSH